MPRIDTGNHGQARESEMGARVALVTGGTGGIGTAICKRLADLERDGANR